MIIEFPPGPISIGEDYRIEPEEIKLDGQILRIFTPTDCIRDRLASHIHFKARECLDQAVLVAQNQPVDFGKIRKWCEAEGAKEIYEEFLKKVKK